MKASKFADAQKAFIVRQGEDGAPVIYSSLNRERFIVRLLSGDGLYPNPEEFSGLSLAASDSPT